MLPCQKYQIAIAASSTPTIRILSAPCIQRALMAFAERQAIRWQIPVWLWWIVVAPRYHHWHHAKEIVDKNFGHPLIDWLFGTFYYPRPTCRDRQGQMLELSRQPRQPHLLECGASPSRKIPLSYGITETVPRSYWGQLKYPWKNKLIDLCFLAIWFTRG
ncbi:MAG: sterol desaturase family protein [Hydrococcus sp. RM1_1_31]|nr:sterol desaturase family protein [Hydrococcus sp. RM1_1_31]